MERRIILHLVFTAFMPTTYGQTPTLLIDNNSIDVGTSVTLNCSVAISGTITFNLDNVAQGSCSAPFLGTPGTCNPNTITQSLPDGMTSWTISPVQPAHHGSWKCTLGTTDSTVEKLTIYKLPVAVLTQSGISADTIVNDTNSYPISLEVDCMFSENDPTVQLEFVSAGTVNASVAMICSDLSTTCSACTGCSAYICNHTISTTQVLLSGQLTKDAAYTLQIKVGVTGTTQTFSQAIFSSHSITFDSTSTSSTLTTTTYSSTFTSSSTSASPKQFQNQKECSFFNYTIPFAAWFCVMFYVLFAIGIGIIISIIFIKYFWLCKRQEQNNTNTSGASTRYLDSEEKRKGGSNFALSTKSKSNVSPCFSKRK